MAGVSLERLSKSYDGGVVAVRELDLRIGDGELLVLVGPSGCGKTTTLRMIAGLESVTGGRILIGERDVTDLEPRDRDIAMVFQNYALYPHMTVRDNLSFGLRMRKTPKAEIRRRIEAVASQLGLEPMLARKPAALSGGQRQRVALGRAMVREPVAFLFDEPLSNLDAKLRVRTRAELVRLHRELGTTMIYVTHDQTEAMTMGERIAVMNQGELQQAASPLEVYDQPANLFVAGFIGSPPMNFFAGTVIAHEDSLRFHGPSFIVTVGRSGDSPGEGSDAIPDAGAGASPESRDVVLGIRPEHLSAEAATGDSGTGGDAVMPATVQVVEALGSETLVHCRTAAGEEAIVRTAGRPALRAGNAVRLRLDPSQLHLFDTGSGRRIRRGDGATADR